jgi:integrase
VTEYRDQPMGVHGLHKWWYRRLQRAGVVSEGVTRGRKMHMAQHTAGQSVLDRTGNLKAVQKLLGHSSITTTGDIYTDWDIDQLEETMRYVTGEDGSGGKKNEPQDDVNSFPPDFAKFLQIGRSCA